MPDAPETGVMTPGGDAVGAKPGKPGSKAYQDNMESMLGAPPGPKPEESPIQADDKRKRQDAGQLEAENRELQEQLAQHQQELDELRKQREAEQARLIEAPITNISDQVLGDIISIKRQQWTGERLAGSLEERKIPWYQRIFRHQWTFGAAMSGTWGVQDLAKHTGAAATVVTTADLQKSPLISMIPGLREKLSPGQAVTLPLDVQDIGRAIQGPKDLLNAARGMVEAVGRPLPAAAMVGFVTKVAGGLFRWIGTKWKTPHFLAKEVVYQKFGRSSSRDVKLIWNALAGRHVPDLLMLKKLAASEGQIDPKVAEKVIREGVRATLTHQLLDDVLPKDQMVKLQQDDLIKQHLEVMQSSYADASTLMGKLPSDVQANIRREMEAWLDRREFRDRVEIILKQGALAGVRTALFAGAFTFARGLLESGIAHTFVEDVARKAGQAADFVRRQIENLANGIGTIFNDLSSKLAAATNPSASSTTFNINQLKTSLPSPAGP